MKTTLMALLVVMFTLIVVVAIFSWQGYRGTKAGVDNVACTSAKLLDVTLSGQISPHFIGMLPLLNIVSTLEEELTDNSAFLNDVQQITDGTKNIDRAIVVASQTMRLLSTVLEDPANRRPSQGGQDLLHQCELCDRLPSLITPAVGALEGGVGEALAEARAEVEAQLTAERRSDLQQRLQESAQPLIDVKTLVRDSFYFLVQDPRYQSVQDFTRGATPPLLVLILSLVVANFLLLSCGCCTGTCWCRYERVKKGRRYDNPYLKRTPRCACCSWCCGFVYAFFAFLFGGTLVVATVAMSSVCLLLDDFNQQTLRDIAPVVGLNLTGDQGIMIKDIVEQCFGQSGIANNSNLADIVFTRENGSRVTMRSKIIRNLKDQIQSKFDLITQRMSGAASLALKNSSQVELLRAFIRDHPLDAMLLPDRPQMQADPLYSGLLQDPRGSGGVAVGLSTSTACGDLVLGPGMGASASQTVPGILTFMDSLGEFGSELPGTTCARQVLCNASLSGPEADACVAGNNFVALKNRLLSTSTFRCNKFELPNGATCDTLNMYRTGTTWFDDCLLNNGTMQVKELTCDLAAFTQYVAQFDVRVDNVFMRLDEAVTEVEQQIRTQLRQLVDDHIVAPIDSVATGVTCGFLGDYYRELVDGLCYQAVPGLWVVGWSYVACGLTAALFAALMYATWRWTMDNRLVWLPFMRMGDEEEGDEVVEVDGIGTGRILVQGKGVASV